MLELDKTESSDSFSNQFLILLAFYFMFSYQFLTTCSLIKEIDERYKKFKWIEKDREDIESLLEVYKERQKDI